MSDFPVNVTVIDCDIEGSSDGPQEEIEGMDDPAYVIKHHIEIDPEFVKQFKFCCAHQQHTKPARKGAGFFTSICRASCRTKAFIPNDETRRRLRMASMI